MKSNEVRDSLTILMVPNTEALCSVIGQPLDKSFSEAYIDLEEAKANYYKSSTVNMTGTAAFILGNFILLIGVSAFNMWQVRIFTGIDSASSQST